MKGVVGAVFTMVYVLLATAAPSVEGFLHCPCFCSSRGSTAYDMRGGDDNGIDDAFWDGIYGPDSDPDLTPTCATRYFTDHQN